MKNIGASSHEVQFSTPLTRRFSSPSNRNAATYSTSSMKKGNASSVTSSSRSLMHSGHSVTKAVSIIPEKSSPINVDKTEFRRVTITPQRMDNAFSAVEYDNKLKALTDPKRVKPSSPQEKLEALSAMANMFDDDDDHNHSTLPSTIEDSQDLSQRKKKSDDEVIAFASKEKNHYDQMFSDSSILEDANIPAATIPERNINNIPSTVEKDNPWIALLNQAVESASQHPSEIPPPFIPRQYDSKAANNTTTSNFSSLVSSLSSNRQQGISSVPSLQPLSRIVRDYDQPPLHSATTPYKTSIPPQLSLIQENMQSPSFPFQTPSKNFTLNLPDISVPSWSPTKSVAELDPSLQPYLNFLKELGQEFFPNSHNTANLGGQDDILRLWQRHMLLPVDQLQEQVFQQHEVLVRLKIFDQLNYDDEAKAV